MNKKGIVRSLISVSGIVALAKILGFVKQMITANAFGATIHTDIITLAQGLVTNLDYVVEQALITAFIPTFIRLKTKEEGKETTFVSNTLVVFFVSSAVIAGVLVLLSGVLAKVIAPSYGSGDSSELAKYIRIVAPLFAVIVQIAIFNALLKSNERFVQGEFVGFHQSVILIVLILLLGGRFGPDTLIIGFYVYTFFNLFFLCGFSRKYLTARPESPFADPNVRNLLKMMGPLLLGYSLVFINQLVDRMIVSGLEEGTVTAMSYAAVLSNFICTFITSLCGVLFTYVTQKIAEQKDEEASDLINQASVWMVTLFLPVSILTVANSGDIVTLVFGRGKFTGNALLQCSSALMGYGFMFVPYVSRELFSRFQYGYGDSRKPMINSTVAIVFNIIFSIVLSRIMGVLGVTIATSFSVLIGAILNIVSSKKKNQYLNLANEVRCLPGWIAGAILCIAVSFAGGHFLSGAHILIRLGTIMIVAFSGYCLINYKMLSPFIKRIIRKA